MTGPDCDPVVTQGDPATVPHPILTQLGVDKARRRGRRYELADGPGGVPGFALRVGETGAKSYVLRYRVGGRQRRATIGSAAVITLAEARARARKLVDQARAGIDPVEANRSRHQGTVAIVVEEYAERHLRRNLRSGAWAEARLKRDVVAAWGERSIQSIAKRDVVALIDSIHDRAPVSANRTLQLIKALMNWCVKRSILEVNAAAGVDLPCRELPRERTLDETEIAAVWQAFETMGHPFGDLGRLLLLTAARRGELAGATWNEIDLEREVWHLPASRVKAGAPHTLPLVPKVLKILEAIPRIAGSDLVFPSGRAGSFTPIAGFSRTLKTAHVLSGTSGWTWHDLRRSARSHLSRIGVRPDIAERVLGHLVGSKLVRTYDHYNFAGEVRQALLLWSAELERIVAGEAAKIVPLRPAL